MQDIRSLIQIAARRLEFTALLARGHIALIILAAVVTAALLAERMGSSVFIPWIWVGPILVATGLVVLWQRFHAGRRSELQVAVEVDGRLDLRERLSTALHLSRRTDAFAVAAVGDAVETARDPRVREQVRRKFGVLPPRRWWMSPLVIAAATAISFLPPLDLFGGDESADASVTDTIERSDEAVKKAIDPIKDNPELQEELSDVLKELANRNVEPDALRNREDIRRNTIKKLTDLNRKLDDIVNGPKGKTAQALDKAMKQLQKPLEGPAKDLGEALAKGDLNAAQEAINKLLEEARNGEIDPAKAAELAAQLNQMAQQMQQLAQQRKQLENMLKQAGLDPQLANNAQALQQAIQNNPNLNQQQKQQLQQAAQAQQAAQQMMQQMAQGMQQMAQGMQQMAQGMQQQGQQGQQMMQQGMQMMQQGQQGMGDQLNAAEMMQQMLNQAQAAAQAAQAACQGLGQGMGMQGMQAMQQWMQQQQQQGGPFGERGQGAGGKAPIAPTPTRSQLKRSNTKSRPGDIIARQFVQGQQVVGESRAKLRQVAAVVQQGFDESLNEDQLPRKYHDQHKHYFGELQQKVTVVADDLETSDPETTPPPATDEGNDG